MKSVAANPPPSVDHAFHRESVHLVVCADGFQENRLLAFTFDETKDDSKVIAKGTGQEPVEFSPEFVSLQARVRYVFLKKMQSRGKRLSGQYTS